MASTKLVPVRFRTPGSAERQDLRFVGAAATGTAPLVPVRFRGRGASARFVKRLALNLRRIAIFIDGEHVRVIDGSPNGQHDEIIRLAKGSSARPVGALAAL